MNIADKIKQYLLIEEEEAHAKMCIENLKESQETPFSMAVANSIEKALIELKAYGVVASVILISKDLEKNPEAENFAMILRVTKTTFLRGLKSIQQGK